MGSKTPGGGAGAHTRPPYRFVCVFRVFVCAHRLPPVSFYRYCTGTGRVILLHSFTRAPRSRALSAMLLMRSMPTLRTTEHYAQNLTCCKVQNSESGRMRIGRCDHLAQHNGCRTDWIRNRCPIACGNCSVCDPARYQKLYMRTARSRRAKAAPSEVAYTENTSMPLDEARKMAIRTGKELSRRARRLLAEEVIRGLSFSHYVADPVFDMPPTQPIFDFVRFRRGRTDQIRWPQ